MLNIMVTKFKDQFRSIIFYSAGLVAYVWMLMALYPSVRTVGYEEILKQYPEDLMKFFGVSETFSISKIEGFLSMEFLSLFFILIVGFYIGSSAGSIVSGAVDKRTMDFDLSQPISRTRLLASGTLVGLLYTAKLTVITSLSIWLLGEAYSVDINKTGLLAFTVLAILFLWAIYGIAIFLSSFMRTKMTVAATTLAILLAFYIFTAMTNIVEKLSRYDKYSLFYMYNPQKLLETGTVDINHALILVLIFILGLSSALIIFNRRDI